MMNVKTWIKREKIKDMVRKAQDAMQNHITILMMKKINI